MRNLHTGILLALIPALALRLAAGPQVATFAPLNLAPVPRPALTTAERLAMLHTALSGPRDPHDIILELDSIGDPSSVPFLIEALAKQGDVPREGPYGGVCTRAHVEEALQDITNHNAGRNADDWRAWYDANKGRTQAQWIKEGFVEHQFPFADPPDDVFVAALIRASGPNYQPRYIGANAQRLLKTVSADTIVRTARPLARDPNVDVAENSLRVLNVALRSTLPPITARQVRDTPAKARGHILHILDDRTTVLTTGSNIPDDMNVVGFDVVANRIIWSYPIHDDVVRSNTVRLGDRLYFVTDGRVLHCITTRGRPVWAKPLTPTPDWYHSGPEIVAARGRLFVRDDKSIYVATPEGEITTYAMGAWVSGSLVRGRHRVFAAMSNGPLLVADDGMGPPRTVSTGLKIAALSAVGDVLCVVSYGPAYQLQCLDQDSLHERWRADLPDHGVAYDSLEQDDENIYALSQEGALAFNVASGKRLWATNEFRSFALFKSFGGDILTHALGSPLEWRDPSSGEVIGVWGVRETSYASSAVRIGNHLLVNFSGTDGPSDSPRLLALPPQLKMAHPVGTSRD